MSDISLTDLLGLPWQRAGRGPDAYDCYGLCQEVLARMSILIPDHEYLETDDAKDNAITIGKASYVRRTQPEVGCIVTVIMKPPYVTHMGVMLDRRNFIHILKRRSVAIEKVDAPIWRNKIEGFFKYVPNTTS